MTTVSSEATIDWWLVYYDNEAIKPLDKSIKPKYRWRATYSEACDVTFDQSDV